MWHLGFDQWEGSEATLCWVAAWCGIGVWAEYKLGSVQGDH